MLRRLVVIALLITGLSAPASGAIGAQVSEPLAVAQELLVAFKVGTSEAAKQAAFARVGATKLSNVVRASEGQNDVDLVRFPASISSSAAIRAFQANPNILYAEPNWILRADATSNDPYYTGGSLWGMYGDNTSPKNAFGTHAGEAWANDKLGSKNTYIGIIDEGIDFNHPDLNANMWLNPFDPVNGRDDDGNGYIDDTRGWDFANNNNTVYDGGTLDRHGTHVAGTIGATGNNGQGVAGVSWNVTMISGKFLGANGGTLANAVKAVNYFTDLKTRHNLNIVATSNSWGGGGYSATLHQAIIRAAKANILFIAAAGNDGVNSDTTVRYPAGYNSTVAAVSSGTTIESAASYDNVIAVAAIASDGSLASFSNYGANSVDIGAPGVGIWSTQPNNGFASYNGTSMATPHVSGAVALINAETGAIGAALRSQILSSVTTYGALTGKVSTNGRLDLTTFGAAPSTIDNVSPTITLSTSTASLVAGTSVTLTATATDNVGVTRVEFYSNGSLINTATTAPFAFTWTVPSAGSYAFTGKAFDAAANSATSNSVTVTATAAPDTTPPTISLASSTASVTAGSPVSFTATASDNVGVTRVEFKVDGSLVATDTSAPYTYSWVPTNPATYALTAVAFDAAGNSTTSNTVNITVSVGADTTNPTVTLASSAASVVVGSSVTLTASASDNVGVTSVEFYVNGSLINTLTTPDFTMNWTAPNTGTYNFTAIAYDAAGNQAASNAVAVTATAPVATGVRASSIVITFYGGKFSNSNLGANVTVSNNLGSTVANARVTISIRNTTTGAVTTGSGTTNSSGQVTFTLKNPPAGWYTADVTAIVATGLTFIDDDTCATVQRPG